jgi:hypothetical protein
MEGFAEVRIKLAALKPLQGLLDIKQFLEGVILE